jgi:hypothetical protein
MRSLTLLTATLLPSGLFVWQGADGLGSSSQAALLKANSLKANSIEASSKANADKVASADSAQNLATAMAKLPSTLKVEPSFSSQSASQQVSQRANLSSVSPISGLSLGAINRVNTPLITYPSQPLNDKRGA